MPLKKTPTSRSALIAFIILLLNISCSILLYYFEILNSLLWAVISSLIIALLAFLIIDRLFVDYVEKRITPIYNTIHNVTLSQKVIKEKIKKERIPSDLSEEANSWALSQKQEMKQLREMERYRKDFLGNVSHELKTPIFNIQGYILTLLDGGLEDEKVNKLYLQRAEKSINRMISIVDDLVSISRLEAGEFKLSLSEFNIVKLVDDIFEGQEMMAESFRIRLEFDDSYDKPIFVRADKSRITEVLNNLIINSIKYGKTNGRTKVGFVDKGDKILIDISDNGIGIGEEHLPRIFERFYRVDKSRSRDSGGTGLGLSIVKHIIQAHNQSINVRSKIGKGTSFIFSLEKVSKK